jgi:thiamine kinase-like enzyme
MNINEIISRIPGWPDVSDLQMKPIGGLTNSNYLIEVNKEKFVLRISGSNTALLGIDRKGEIEAMETAAAEDLCPEIIHTLLPEGHLVTRYIDGRHWTYEEYCQPENLNRMVDAVKAVHNLPAIKTEVSSFRRIEHYMRQIQVLGVPYPDGFDAAIDRMETIEERLKSDSFPARALCHNDLLKSDSFPARALCHNDLFSLNFIDDGRLRFLDWEFAGMGDIFYDLATLAYSFDSVGEIPSDLQGFILECYFGKTNDYLWTRMEEMKFMVLLYSVMWGLLQSGLEQAGIIPSVDGFDYLDYAQFMFSTIRESNFL